MTLKSQLSHLMPVAEACGVLGEDRVSTIVSSVLKMQSVNQKLLKTTIFSKQQQETLDEATADETSALVHSMLYTTNSVKKTSKADSDLQAAFLEQAMQINKRNSTLTDTSLVDAPTHEQHIPPPIRACWKKLNSRSLSLDKPTLLKFLVPSSAQPHQGPGGHQGLYDCLTYALQSKPSSATPSSGGGLDPTPLVTIPDICIFFAICHKYWLLHTENNPDAIVDFHGDHPTITVMAQWIFLVYDSYQKKGMVTRDTIHRFMSDIYGEESYKTSPMVDVLNRIFHHPSTPLTSREFVRAIVDTMSYSPLPSHFLLDWMAALAKAMMPPKSLSCASTLHESAEAFLQTMDRQKRYLPQICDQIHLAEHRLYEIKRRFHSLVESSTTVIQGDPMGETAESTENDKRRQTNGSTSANISSSNANKTFPKHVIPASVFYQNVCFPNDEFGNGGYLPHSIAERVFESVAKQASFTPTDDVDSEDETEIDIETKTQSYWDLAHVLQYGGICVRAEDDDEALVKWILRLFCTRDRKVLDKGQVRQLLMCLCEHTDFRNLSDRPRWEIEEEDTRAASDDDDQVGASVVNLRTALVLRLLPDSYAHTEAQTPEISIDVLVDHMLKTVKSKDGTLSVKQLFAWHRNTKMYEQQRLGPFIMELRLIASVLFGVPPKLASMEKRLITEIQERHRRRYPQTDVSRRGPRGTVWYIIDDKWYKLWAEVIQRCSRTSDDGEDLRDRSIDNTCPRRITQISNRGLLKENGSLALRADIKWRHDYEILPPLAWSALQAWYDGGPPIYRTVVPYSSIAATSSSGGPGRGPTSLRTENEIELYPIFVTMFLCDSTSRGEARPFQQQVPVSRVSPLRVLLVQLCKGLETDPDMARLWVMDPTDPEPTGEYDCLLNLDANIVDQRKGKSPGDGSGVDYVKLLLELRDEETGLWPRGVDGKDWTFKRDDINAINIGDGIVGLYNMGNTCYLNSSIQCLSHTPIFRDYFTSKCYLNDINKSNPAGYEGRLAQATAVLIQNLWKRFNQQAIHQPKRVTAPGSYAPVNAPALTPKTFKETIGSFDDRFAGNEQHDAQELLTFLLDGLSEELNRIKDKPYIEHPDSDGRPDNELADIWWSNLLKREMSFIIAMFHGQYKSLLRCKSCKYESARFENFSCLTLPLPEDDTIPVSVLFYPNEPDSCITRYSVRVHHNGNLYSVLNSLAKVLYKDECEKQQHHNSNWMNSDLPEIDMEAENARLEEVYKTMAKNMAVVDMRDGYIFKIAPNSWRLPDLQSKDTGELPQLHIYGLDPQPDENSLGKDDDDDPEDVLHAFQTSFLAFAQRRSELESSNNLHPWSHQVFGTPLLLRITDLDKLMNREVYDTVAQHLQPYVPHGALKFISNASQSFEGDVNREREGTKSEVIESKTKQDKRLGLPKTLSDAEEVSAGRVPRYGFRLRLTTRDGRRCGLCEWYDCCIGCSVPDDDRTTILSNGDSLSIDWHLAVDVATSGFGTRCGYDQIVAGVPRSRALGAPIKNHYSCTNCSKNKAESRKITLEDCLDEFAKEEKIPEVYCSRCKDYKMQMKRMSLWRLPPVVIIHLKRFQCTQHMRRKLRDFVEFPVEGLDLSRIMARDGPVSTPRIVGNTLKESSINGNEDREDPMNGSKPDHRDPGSPDKDGSANVNDKKTNSSELASPPKTDDGVQSDMLYDLYGVVHHQGALSTGHYVASLKSDVDGQWRLFNDAQVFEIHSRDIVDSSAYLLFYIRRDVKGKKLSDFWDLNKRDGSGVTEEEMDSLMKGGSDRCVIC